MSRELEVRADDRVRVCEGSRDGRTGTVVEAGPFEGDDGWTQVMVKFDDADDYYGSDEAQPVRVCTLEALPEDEDPE